MNDAALYAGSAAVASILVKKRISLSVDASGGERIEKSRTDCKRYTSSFRYVVVLGCTCWRDWICLRSESPRSPCCYIG